MKHTCSALRHEEHRNVDCKACRAQDNITCTCPGWWFPWLERDRLRKVPHGLGGIFKHHETCTKALVGVA